MIERFGANLGLYAVIGKALKPTNEEDVGGGAESGDDEGNGTEASGDETATNEDASPNANADTGDMDSEDLERNPNEVVGTSVEEARKIILEYATGKYTGPFLGDYDPRYGVESLYGGWRGSHSSDIEQGMRHARVKRDYHIDQSEIHNDAAHVHKKAGNHEASEKSWDLCIHHAKAAGPWQAENCKAQNALELARAEED